MKKLIPALLLAAVIHAGCAGDGKKPAPSAAGGGGSLAGGPASPTNAPPVESGKLIVTPGDELTGKVMVYNDAGRFVVLDFQVGHLPAVEQRMFVYRHGLKVGEVKITGPQREHHTVADLVAGEAQKGDEVRDK